jgi:Mor family transcriptional regulator
LPLLKGDRMNQITMPPPDMAEQEIEEWVILTMFKCGATMRGLAKKFKKKVPEIEDIIRRKWVDLETYKPLARRK